MVNEVAPAPASEKPFRFRKRLWGALGFLLVGGLGFNALSEWRDSHALLINSSESLPNWAFLLHRSSAPVRGDYVFFMPPIGPLVVRHFGAESHMFGKIVYGMPGEIVSHVGGDVFVAGKLIGRMKPRSRLGEILVPGPVGVIPPGCYYVGSPHKDGFDSRYAAIGFACTKAIVGVGQPIL